jgi:thiol-disulfide isomerase/thioredoxin
MVNIIEYENMKLENFSSGLHALLFFLPDCGPCEALYPVIERLSEDYPNIAFSKLNYSIYQPNYRELVDKFEIKYYPSLLVLKNGEKVELIRNNENYESSIRECLNSFS